MSKPLDANGRRSYKTAAMSVSLEKGGHPILLLQFVDEAGKGGDRPLQLRLRQSDGSFQPVPAEWYRH